MKLKKGVKCVLLLCMAVFMIACNKKNVVSATIYDEEKPGLINLKKDYPKLTLN